MKNKQTFYLTGLDNSEDIEKIEQILQNKTRIIKATADPKKGTLEIFIKDDYEKLTEDAVQCIIDSVSENIIVSETKRSEAITVLLLSFTTLLSIIIFIIVQTVGFTQPYVVILSALAAIIAGYDVLINAAKNLFRLNPEQNLLIAAACIPALFIGAHSEAVLVLIIFRLGNIIKHFAMRSVRSSINRHINIRPDTARIQLEDGTYKNIPAKDVPVGSVILLNPNEKLAIDGIVIQGECKVDGSAITGDSKPFSAKKNTALLSGMVCCDFPIHLETTETFENSTASAVMNLVRNSTSKKATLEKTIYLISKIMIPLIILAAIPIYLFVSPYAALTVLVAASPCAVLFSLPVGFFASIGMLSSNGILIKGGRSLENLSKAKNIAFDKTGTLTENNLTVTEIIDLGDVGEESIITLCAALEQFSSHPIAKAVLARAQGLEIPTVSEVKEKTGYGVTAEVNGKHLLCGSGKLLETCGISVEGIDANLYLSFGKKLLGAIKVSTKPLESAKNVISELKRDGAENIFMLSGDNEKTARHIADEIGIKNVRVPLLPEEKIEELKKIESEYGSVIYVGDGVNDENVIKSAQTGVAMGLASNVAANTAEIVLIQNNLSNLPNARNLAYRAMNTIFFNLWITLVVKFLLIVFGFFGYVTMWPAILIDIVFSLLTLLNSARILKIK